MYCDALLIIFLCSQLVGEYYPPPGTPAVLGPPDAAETLSKLKAQLHGPGINRISALEPFVSSQRSTSSLPTTPLTDKSWVPSWPQTNQVDVLKPSRMQTPQRSTSHDKGDSKGGSKEHGASTRALKEARHIPIRRGKSEASLQICNRKAPGITDMIEHSDDGSCLCRESPDGSSGSSDWPLMSPVSQPVPFIKKDSPQMSSTSSSPIARLVKGELIKSETGARPKESYSVSLPKNSPSVPHYHHQLDVSDSSEIGGSISPSLLQVNYGETNLPHNSSKSSLDVKTPQLRRRPSGGRLTAGHVDSDQDSEETVDGGTVQGSRRRKRANVSQHRSSLSVKLLVDSRGVLGSEQDKSSGTTKNLKKNLMKKHSKSSGDAQESSVEASKVKSQCHTKQAEYLTVPSEQKCESTSDSSRSENIATPSSISNEKAIILASSVPGTATKSSLSPSDVGKSKKKTHSRSRSDGSQEIVGKLKLATSSTDPTLETGMKLGDEAIFGSQIRKRFMDDGGHSITPAADYGVSPRPQPGQSLIGFLSSKDKPYAELDRENAHFNISEAVIAALTQVRSYTRFYCLFFVLFVIVC